MIFSLLDPEAPLVTKVSIDFGNANLSLEQKCKLVLVAIESEYPWDSAQHVRFPFTMPNGEIRFFLHAEDTSQGSFSFFPVVSGNMEISDAFSPKDGANPRTSECMLAQATAFLKHCGVSEMPTIKNFPR